MYLRILTILNLRDGEQKNAGLMLAQYFFMGAAMLFVQSASLALFFKVWEPSAMPYIYLGIALIVSSITSLFLKIGEKTSLARFLTLCMLFVLGGTIVLRVIMAFTASKWLYLILPIWSQTLVNVSVMAFWTLAGNIFDVRQGKRIFGLMNAGSWLAYVVMGPFTSPLVNLIGTENLYIVIVACLLIAFVLQIIIFRSNPSVSNPPASNLEHEKAASIVSLFRNSYLLRIFLLIALFRVSYFILDNIFYERVALQYPNTDQMAGFIGGFYGVVGILGFITDVFITGRILSRFGLRVGLLVTPALTVLSICVLALAGVIDSSLSILLFWLAISGKFLNEGLGFSVDQSASAILYQPLAEKDRARAQTVAEGIVQPLAIGLAGGLLLMFNTLLQFNVIQISFVYIVFGTGWFLLGLSLVRAYPIALTEALHKHRFGDNGIAISDAAGKNIFYKAVESEHSSEVIYALDMLEKSADEKLPELLTRLINSPAFEVRLNAIQRIERLDMREAMSTIKQNLKSEAHPAVKEACARAAAIFEKDINVPLKLLKDPDAFIRYGTMIGLLKSQQLSNVPDAVEMLNALTRSKSIDERVVAARMIGEIGKPELYQQLLPLLNDENLLVINASLRAAAKTHHSEIWEKVIEHFGSPKTRTLAFHALISGADNALPQIVAGIASTSMHRRVHIRLVRACAHIKSDAAIDALLSNINHFNTTLRSRVLAALTECKYSPAATEIQMIKDQIEVEFSRAAWTLAAIHDLGDSEKMSALNRALSRDLQDTRDRLFYLFAFIYDERSVRRARASIARKDNNRRSLAVEVMDSILSDAHKIVFVPLLEDFSPAVKLEKMGSLYKQDSLSRAARVIDLLNNKLARQNPWIVATALDVARKLGIVANDNINQSLITSQESLIYRMANRTGAKETMLSTVERVIILKSLSIFADTPDEALVELADLLKEIQAPVGYEIIKKGDLGDSLFIVISGKVEVVDGNRVLNQLGARAVFGELSLLDSALRTATVRAIEESVLLRLDQTPFYEILGDYVEVAMGTIHMLTRHLRSRTDEVLELNRMLEK